MSMDSAHGSFLKAHRIIQHQEGIRGKVFQEGGDLAEEHLVLIHAGEIALLLKCFQVAGCPGQQLICLFPPASAGADAHSGRCAASQMVSLIRSSFSRVIKGFPVQVLITTFCTFFQRPVEWRNQNCAGNSNFVAEKFNAHGLG